MSKLYYYFDSCNCENSTDEYLVKAEDEIEALLEVTVLKYIKGDSYIIARLKYLREISFKNDCAMDLCTQKNWQGSSRRKTWRGIAIQ